MEIELFNLRKFELIKHIVRNETTKINLYADRTVYENIYNILNQARTEIKTALISNHVNQSVRIKTIRTAICGTLSENQYSLFSTDHAEKVRSNIEKFSEAIEYFHHSENRDSKAVEYLIEAMGFYTTWATLHSQIIECSRYITNEAYTFLISSHETDIDVSAKELDQFATDLVKIIDSAIQNIVDINLTFNIKRLENTERETYLHELQHQLCNLHDSNDWK